MSNLRAALLGSVFLGGLALASGQPAALPNQAPSPPGDPAEGIEPVVNGDFSGSNQKNTGGWGQRR